MDNVFIAIVHQRHLALEVTDVVFQAFPWFHFHYKEIVFILLELNQRSKLVAEGVCYIFKATEGVLWERVELMVSDSLEARRERHI